MFFTLYLPIILILEHKTLSFFAYAKKAFRFTGFNLCNCAYWDYISQVKFVKCLEITKNLGQLI